MSFLQRQIGAATLIRVARPVWMGESGVGQMNAVAETLGEQRSMSVRQVPVNLFAAVMGLSGLSLAWRRSHAVFGAPAVIGDAIGLLAMATFAVVAAVYLVKWIRHPAEVVAEFIHPVSGNFFGTVNIAMLLLSSVVAAYSALLGQIVWIIGTLATLMLAYIILSRLLTVKQDPTHASPVWLIPGVAALDIANAGSAMPFTWAPELNLFAAAIGSVLAVVFFILILSRLFHHDALSPLLLPSIFILIAPFEVGFLAYTNLVGQVDNFGALLYYFGLALFAVLFFKVFRPSTPFSQTWWAASFPMAALGNAALVYAAARNSGPTLLIAAVVLAVISLMIGLILLRTLHHLFTGRLFEG